MGKIPPIRNYFSSRKNHWLFPILSATVTVVVGLLTHAWIGALCFILTIYLALVIFVPWNLIHWDLFVKRRTLFSFITPVIICLIIFIPTWNSVLHIFPNSDGELIPNNPVIELIPNPDVTTEVPTEATVKIYAQIKPAYESYIQPKITITNPPDSPLFVTYTFLFSLTGGFKFSEISPENVPSQFFIKEGYEYSANMTLVIKDCPSRDWVFPDFKIPVHNMDKNTLPLSENENFHYIIQNKQFQK